MSRLVSRAENWERVHEAFNSVNFAAFDYNTIKQSLLDYIKLHFPETYNDYIESSELIAIIESFAYVGELLSYRFDLDAHENFLPVAQRKDSILRLAKLVSYTADRPIPARGLVKITSVSTTESIVDAVGNNLANRTIRWNDSSNQQWKDQFILIMNRVLEQNFGTVRSTDRFQLENVLFELYALNISPLTVGTVGYTASVNNQTVPMELVPVEYDTSDGIVERRPYNNSNFTILYGRDGLGDTSDTTGFFCYTKQGSLTKFRKEFDGVTPNQIYDIPLNDVNETDVWVNNVNSTTNETVDLPSLLPYRRESLTGKSGEWVQVDLAHAQNVIFNTNPHRNKYEVETRDNNRVRIIFGDGEFADVPAGTFDFWVRTSVDQDIIVSQSAVVNVPASFAYTDSYGRSQTFSFTFSLINSLQNSSASESLEHIRTTAPAVYYAQDRMVNGQDYNSFMLQDSSILKLRSMNRTFAGDSKYIQWHDPSTHYENVKMFGDDGALFFQEKYEGVITPIVNSISELITLHIEPLLSSTDIFLYVASYGVSPSLFRRTFSSTERSRLESGLTPPPSPTNINLFYNLVTYDWHVVQSSDNPETALASVGWPSSFIESPLISIVQQQTDNKYQVTRLAKRLTFYSPTMKFWNNNSASQIVEYNTLATDLDKVVILQANTNNNRDGMLSSSWNFNVLGLETIDSGNQLGLPDVSKISVLPVDENGDGIPDHLDINNITNPAGLANIINPKILVNLTNVPTPFPTTGYRVTLPIYYVIGQGDITIQNLNGVEVIPGTDWIEDIDNESNVSNEIFILGSGLENALLVVTVNEYVYFNRSTTTSDWVTAPNTLDTLNFYFLETIVGTGLWKREIGRSGLNFAWFHYSPRYHLIDPAASNIVDTLIIQKGYFLALKRWLEDPLAIEPTTPTPLDLRLAYNYLLDNKMISDTVVLHPGKIKLLFGSRAILPLQAVFKVVKSSDTTKTDNQIKTTIVTTIRNFFNISNWEFGETFYFTELATAIHAALPIEISSVVIVPILEQNQFGDMFQVLAREDEIFYPDINVEDIDIVEDINEAVLRMNKPNICPRPARQAVSARSTAEYAYDHVQTLSNSTWTITHDLGYYPIVRVYTLTNQTTNDVQDANATYEEVQPASVLHLNIRETIINFNVPTIGIARLV